MYSVLQAPLCFGSHLLGTTENHTFGYFSFFSEEQHTGETSSFFSFLSSFIPSLFSRLITEVKNFKGFENPVATLETKLVFLLGASMFLQMVQAFFKVRQTIKNITQRSAQKLDSSEWVGGIVWASP